MKRSIFLIMAAVLLVGGMLARKAPCENTATAGQYTGRSTQGNRLCTRYSVPRNSGTDSGSGQHVTAQATLKTTMPRLMPG